MKVIATAKTIAASAMYLLDPGSAVVVIKHTLNGHSP
jgi:hypothetical protein